MMPPEEVKLGFVRQWLAKADEDIRACEALVEGDPPFCYPACFHAQQAAEKYLKALLTRHQIEFPKTHDIGQLLGLLRPAFPDLASELGAATFLTPFGVEIRYPGDQPEPTVEDARQALELAQRVRDAARPLASAEA
jgi:HEPN domain-containing protein